MGKKVKVSLSLSIKKNINKHTHTQIQKEQKRQSNSNNNCKVKVAAGYVKTEMAISGGQWVGGSAVDDRGGKQLQSHKPDTHTKESYFI